jgi:hypothetical protein
MKLYTTIPEKELIKILFKKTKITKVNLMSDKEFEKRKKDLKKVDVKNGSVKKYSIEF